MKRLFVNWLRDQRLYLMAGALLWVIIAAASWQYSRSTGGAYLPTMVTWDEWAVAVLLLPRVGSAAWKALNMATRSSRMNTAMQNVMYGGSPQAVVDQIHEDLATEAQPTRSGWSSRLGTVALATFVLDLLIRGVYGLGWQPFI